MSNQIRICLATAALLAAQLQSASAQLPPQQGELAICRGFAAGYTVVVQRYPGGEYVYVTANGQVAINKVTDDMAGARNRQHVADELREFTLKTPTGYTARLYWEGLELKGNINNYLNFTMACIGEPPKKPSGG